MLDEETWKSRYRKRLMDKTDLGFLEADKVLEAADWPDIYDGYEDDPEGSADEEMSYWEP
jgi:hypothetical protein